jgi:calcineurin-like phosphoesterase family protein
VRLARLLLALILAAGCAAGLPVPVYEGAIDDAAGPFVLYGDSRPRLAGEIWRDDSTEGRLAVLAHLAELRPAFALNSGDLVAQGSHASDWAQLDRETAALRESGVPLFAGLGNHDLAGGAEDALYHVRRRFPSLRARRWYTLDHAGVRLVVLDTNLDATAAEERDAEFAWFVETLDAAERDSAVRDVIVVSHHPPFTNAPWHEPSGWVRDTLLPAAAAHGKVRAFVSGHAHTYERFRSGAIDCIVSGGGGAPLVPPRKDRRDYPDLYDGPRGHHVLLVRPGTPTTIEVQMLVAPGRWEVVDRVVLGAGAEKPAPPRRD